jgi:putative NIF3 family GTP cyclohydrolase 1 type 2
MNTIREHMFRMTPWVDPERSNDKIWFGDADKPVKRIGTGWTPCVHNLEAAAADGCELFISHESPFYGLWAPQQQSEDTCWGKRRIAVLKESCMGLMNLHDTWDNFPEVGIRDSWRRFLRLGELLAERPYYNPASGSFTPRPSLCLCAVEPQTLAEFAQSVAERTCIFPSSHGVTFCGNPRARLTKIATGVGCHIPTQEMIELGADALVLTFDRGLQTTVRLPLLEMGANIVVVEHGVAEMPGMQSMAEYLNRAFPGVEAKFYCHEPRAWTIVG